MLTANWHRSQSNAHMTVAAVHARTELKNDLFCTSDNESVDLHNAGRNNGYRLYAESKQNVRAQNYRHEIESGRSSGELATELDAEVGGALVKPRE